jgi:nuclear transport factor 2 (NTF2) superfamily protein
VSRANLLDSRWRDRAEFVVGRPAIVAFLARKWSCELDYRLIKEIWAFEGRRIADRFAYEFHDDSRDWFRAYGTENWAFNPDGLMQQRFACINDLPIRPADRLFHWHRSGPRSADHAPLTDLGL